MIITKITIDNYRGIKSDSFSPSPMTCIIGENNAGKSSLLIAISLFFNGSILSKSDYYNPNNEIIIEIEFSDITENDLVRLTKEHKEIIVDGKLVLVRNYGLDGKSKLYYKKLGPKDLKLSENTTSAILKGKSGKDIETCLCKLFPEKCELFEGITTQKAGKEKIKEIIAGLEGDELELKLAKLPTGMEKSIKNFLPEPVYIAAVKDLKDEVKTKETTTFGKLLGILLRFLENTSDFEEISNSFDKLHGLLNVIETEDGLKDNRIQRLKTIENQIEGCLKESFPNVRIEINVPKPELKQVFSNSQILIDDGVKDTIETKGDGIKRALTFSLLRTYVDQLKEHKNHTLHEQDGHGEIKINNQPYIFLFEEPELYLHPNAQRILFDALESLSEVGNQVFVTTHSPMFFSPDTTGTFVKIVKKYPDGGIPYGKLLTVNLQNDLAYKDAFQILCYENNTPAFFSNKVLLVEGDSDFIYLKELAKKLDPKWNFDNHNIPIIKINGKSNIKRFMDFYEKFETKVYSLVDLDMLVDGFEKYSVSRKIIEKRQKLLEKIDAIADRKNLEPNLKKDKIRELTRRYTWKEKYNRLKDLADKVMQDQKITADERLDIEYLFAEETNDLRRQVFTSSDGEFPEKYELLKMLRDEDIFILSKGAIEKYYPTGVTGNDKPSKALNAVSIIKNMGDPRDFLPKIGQGEETSCEMDLILEKIFG